jgi:hypothetical protein
MRKGGGHAPRQPEELMKRRKGERMRFVLKEVDADVPIEDLASNPNNTYVTAEEAARIAGVGLRYIYVMLREERVKAVWINARRVQGRMVGGRCYFNLASVQSADVCLNYCVSRGRKTAVR